MLPGLAYGENWLIALEFVESIHHYSMGSTRGKSITITRYVWFDLAQVALFELPIVLSCYAWSLPWYLVPLLCLGTYSPRLMPYMPTIFPRPSLGSLHIQYIVTCLACAYPPKVVARQMVSFCRTFLLFANPVRWFIVLILIARYTLSILVRHACFSDTTPKLRIPHTRYHIRGLFSVDMCSYSALPPTRPHLQANFALQCSRHAPSRFVHPD